MFSSCKCQMQNGNEDVPGVWKKGDKAGKAAGRKHLKEALKGHNSWKPFNSGKVLRFTDQLDVSGMTAPQASYPHELTSQQLASLLHQIMHVTPCRKRKSCMLSCRMKYTLPACQDPQRLLPELHRNSMPWATGPPFNNMVVRMNLRRGSLALICSIFPESMTGGVTDSVLQCKMTFHAD